MQYTHMDKYQFIMSQLRLTQRVIDYTKDRGAATDHLERQEGILREIADEYLKQADGDRTSNALVFKRDHVQETVFLPVKTLDEIAEECFEDPE